MTGDDGADQVLLLGWLSGVQAGKADALAALYDATLGRLYALAMRIMRNSADAGDVIADSFRQIWERPNQYDAERGPVWAWLQIIVRSRALDALRRKQSQQRAQVALIDAP